MAMNAARTEAGTPVLESAEEVLHTERGVQAFFDGPPFNSQGQGDLFVTSRRVVWLDSANTNNGFGVDFTTLSVHAICTDTSTFPHACIYCQVDTDDDSLSELRFVPSSQSSLTGLYSAFSAAAEMNPDPPGSDDDDQGDFFFDEEEVKTNLQFPEVTEDIAVRMTFAEQPVDGRFADAEEEEEEDSIDEDDDDDEGDDGDEEMAHQDGA